MHGIPVEALYLLGLWVLAAGAILGIPASALALAARGKPARELLIGSLGLITIAVTVAALDPINLGGPPVWRFACVGGALLGGAVTLRASIRHQRLPTRSAGTALVVVLGAAVFATTVAALLALLVGLSLMLR